MSTMDEKPTTEKSLLETTLDEHHGCMQVVADVEACLDRHPDTEGRWLAELADKLPRLTGTLREHFTSEEQGPMFRKLPISHPRLAQRLDRLEAEHQRILDDADEVTTRVRELKGGPQAAIYDLHEINARVRLLVARIQRHEAQENELVLEAHWTEVGTGD